MKQLRYCEAAYCIKTTGLSLLDRALGDGLSSGSVVYILSDPETNAEAFLFHFTQPRRTFYFATARESKYIIQDMKFLGFEVSSIEFVDVFGAYYHSSLEITDRRKKFLEKCNAQTDGNCPLADIINREEELFDHNLLDYVKNMLQGIMERDVTIIIDAFHFLTLLNVKRNNIKELMHIIYDSAKENDAIVYLFTLRNTMDSKIENELMGHCDVIFDIRLVRSGDKLTNELAITKARNIEASSDILKFFVRGKVVIDSSMVVV